MATTSPTFKDSHPKKTNIPLRDVCVQYENNPANGFWDIQNSHLQAETDGLAAGKVDDNIPRPTPWAGG